MILSLSEVVNAMKLQFKTLNTPESVNRSITTHQVTLHHMAVNFGPDYRAEILASIQDLENMKIGAVTRETYQDGTRDGV